MRPSKKPRVKKVKLSCGCYYVEEPGRLPYILHTPKCKPGREPSP